ncbi:MAG: ABC transporter permease [Chloroflexi bacterium]|nr:ABC transporter permease [Chloroflexota bacterium]
MSELSFPGSQATPPRQLDALERAPKQRSYWSDAWVSLLCDRVALAGGILVVLMFFLAVGADWFAPYDPLKQFPEGLTARGAPIEPNAQFLLGTDNLGRDLLSRLIWGGRISLTVSILANLVSLAVAIVVGGAAGFLRGAVDTFVMRTVDIALSFPTLILQIALATVLPPSIGTVIVVISIFAWAYPARVFRGQILSIRERSFVESARSIGASELRIFVRHILPQLLPTIVVYFTIRVPSAILTEASLSFLGLGVPPPTPSWGNMILSGYQLYRQAPWVVLFPGFAIMIAVLGFNLLGDGLRDALDPRERR